jgi:hypothetical protein
LRRWRDEGEWLPIGLRRVDGIGWVWNGVCHWGDGAISARFQYSIGLRDCAKTRGGR